MWYNIVGQVRDAISIDRCWLYHHPMTRRAGRRYYTMGNIINVSFNRSGEINASQINKPSRKVDDALLLPATEDVTKELAKEHASEPIKKVEDIERISKFLIDNERWRDNMLFIVGINFGLRVSDLLQLRFCDLIDDTLTFRTTFPILEIKTRNTRKVAKNRYITVNDAVIEAVTLYLTHCPSKLDDYMFRSESNRCTQNKPMSRNSVERILKEIVKELDIHVKVATHTLRKTFGYHQMMMSGNDPRKLLLLQKIFGHSSSGMTLDYIGITREEIQESYMGLNLGSRSCYSKLGTIGEHAM